MLLAALLAAAPAPASVTVEIDSATLNELLSAVTEQDVDLAITETRSLTVRLDNLRLLRLDPAAGERQQGQILTSVRVRVPDLGLDMTVEPRISLKVIRVSGQSLIELRFEKLELPLPLLGQFNLAGLLEPTRFPADNIWVVDGASGEQNVKSQLADIEMGRETMRFKFDVQVLNGP
jgi:hypothetical protein